MILDPNDPKVIAAAKESGIPDDVITAAQRSRVYKYVKEWELTLPLHPEFRTLPMLFHVPPLLSVSVIYAAAAPAKAGMSAEEAEAIYHRTSLPSIMNVLSSHLLDWQRVILTVPLEQIIGQAGKCISCETCGEEIINQREVICEGTVMCRSCAGGSYFSYSLHTANC